MMIAERKKFPGLRRAGLKLWRPIPGPSVVRSPPAPASWILWFSPIRKISTCLVAHLFSHNLLQRFNGTSNLYSEKEVTLPNALEIVETCSVGILAYLSAPSVHRRSIFRSIAPRGSEMAHNSRFLCQIGEMDRHIRCEVNV